jgi:L,D-peptidoglycan transpeptidase YkuD (ErfK/YbiS/YcfS/YnhG family)
MRRRRALLVAAASIGAALTISGPTGGRPASASARASCAAPLPRLAAPQSVTLITVVAPATDSEHAALSLYRRVNGCFVLRAGPFPAWLGSSGLSTDHVEGSPTTPSGLFRIGTTAYGALSDPGLALSYHRLTCGDWWDEDPTSNEYNRFVHVPCGMAPPFGGDSEALWRALPAYDYFAVIEYNAAPTIPGRGSAIFLHIATGKPTAGCVSLASGALLTVLRQLVPAQAPLIAIGTAEELRSFRTPSNL